MEALASSEKMVQSKMQETEKLVHVSSVSLAILVPSIYLLVHVCMWSWTILAGCCCLDYSMKYCSSQKLFIYNDFG